MRPPPPSPTGGHPQQNHWQTHAVPPFSSGRRLRAVCGSASNWFGGADFAVNNWSGDRPTRLVCGPTGLGRRRGQAGRDLGPTWPRGRWCYASTLMAARGPGTAGGLAAAPAPSRGPRRSPRRPHSDCCRGAHTPSVRGREHDRGEDRGCRHRPASDHTPDHLVSASQTTRQPARSATAGVTSTASA